MSILLTEETGALHTLKDASKITAKVAFVLDQLKADNAWQARLIFNDRYYSSQLLMVELL